MRIIGFRKSSQPIETDIEADLKVLGIMTIFVVTSGFNFILIKN